jgi:hypothetical protein
VPADFHLVSALRTCDPILRLVLHAVPSESIDAPERADGSHFVGAKIKCSRDGGNGPKILNPLWLFVHRTHKPLSGAGRVLRRRFSCPLPVRIVPTRIPRGILRTRVDRGKLTPSKTSSVFSFFVLQDSKTLRR